HKKPFARLVSFVSEWEEETKKELTELRNEQLMWGELDVLNVLERHNLPAVTARQGYVENHITELGQALVQLDALQGLIDDYKCTSCDGTGQTGYMVPGGGIQDAENHMSTCAK